MSFTKSTPNYKLPQYEANDPMSVPSWNQDVTDAFATIDSAMAETAANVTKNKGDTDAAIAGVEQSVTQVETTVQTMDNRITTADTKATNALANANTANTTAEQANATAEQANATAEEAKTTAEEANNISTALENETVEIGDNLPIIPTISSEGLKITIPNDYLGSFYIRGPVSAGAITLRVGKNEANYGPPLISAIAADGVNFYSQILKVKAGEYVLATEQAVTNIGFFPFKKLS